jgi:hypothetical protein
MLGDAAHNPRTVAAAAAATAHGAFLRQAPCGVLYHERRRTSPHAANGHARRARNPNPGEERAQAREWAGSVHSGLRYLSSRIHDARGWRPPRGVRASSMSRRTAWNAISTKGPPTSLDEAWGYRGGAICAAGCGRAFSYADSRASAPAGHGMEMDMAEILKHHGRPKTIHSVTSHAAAFSSLSRLQTAKSSVNAAMQNLKCF